MANVKENRATKDSTNLHVWDIEGSFPNPAFPQQTWVWRLSRWRVSWGSRTVPSQSRAHCALFGSMEFCTGSMTISRDTCLTVTPLILGVLIRSNSKPDSYVKNIAQIRTFLHADIMNVFTRRSSYHKDDIRLVLLPPIYFFPRLVLPRIKGKMNHRPADLLLFPLNSQLW